MPVKCQICFKEFPSIISSSHLKTHNITSQQYKEKYGKQSLASDEYRQAKSIANRGKNNPNYNNKWTDEQKNHISEINSGKESWNKGKTLNDYTNEHQESIKAGTRKREEKYENNELIRPTFVRTQEMKQKISKSVTEYAKSNPAEIKERAQKATKTKIENNYDFGSNMRNKKHSDKSKKLISEASKKSAEQKKLKSQKRILDMLESQPLRIISDINAELLDIRCEVCKNVFSITKQYFSPSKFKSEMCPTCYPRDVTVSAGEKELAKYISTIYDGNIVRSNRTVLDGKELDIYLPQLNIGIEYNGLYWHSELQLIKNNQSPKKDYEKYQLAQEKNVRLIQIYEDEWRNSQDIVKSRLSAIVSKTAKRIYARKTILREIKSKEANQFIKANHIQGVGRSNVRYGLFFDNNLVSVMTFSKSNISRKVGQWEIDRFCSMRGVVVVGGANKLFSKFIKTYSPATVISYSDNRWNTGNVYYQLGMTKKKETVPGYWYFKPNECNRIHRFTLRKSSDDDQLLTEWENRINQGYNRVWDCGHTLWEYSVFSVDNCDSM